MTDDRRTHSSFFAAMADEYLGTLLPQSAANYLALVGYGVRTLALEPMVPAVNNTWQCPDNADTLPMLTIVVGGAEVERRR